MQTLVGLKDGNNIVSDVEVQIDGGNGTVFNAVGGCDVCILEIEAVRPSIVDSGNF